MLSRHSVRVLSATLLAAMALAACSRGPSNNEYVRYRGETLEVEGNPYRREGTALPAAPGHVRVVLREGSRDGVLARLGDFGLEVDGEAGGGTLRVKVPQGYEGQWAQALSMESGIVTTALDDPSAPVSAPASNAALVANDPPAGNIPMPDTPPSPADVVRLTRQQYARIEAAGGVALVMSSTGKPFVIHSQLAEVTPDGCKRLPADLPEQYECGVLLKVRACTGDCDPSGEDALDDAKRIDVRWDAASGRWELG